MTDEPPRSPSGSPLYHHKQRTIPFQKTEGDGKVIDAVSEHIEATMGPIAQVFHEIVSDLVHVDVHVVKPTQDRPFYTLVTSGMSEAPMTTPAAARDVRFAELMIRLPADWPMGLGSPEAMKRDFSDERNYWPIRLLKGTARMPHEFDTWLSNGHTVSNGNPPEPYAPGVPMRNTILLPSPHLEPKDHALSIGDRKTYFWSLYPLHPDELDFKLKHGADLLWDRLLEAGVTDVLQPNRPSIFA